MSSQDQSLDILVIGAGIGGLATAVALSRSLSGSKSTSGEESSGKICHRITVLERYPSLREIGAGIQILPSASRTFCSWGLRSDFEAVANVLDSMEIRRYCDNEPLGSVPQNLGNMAEKTYGSPHWTVHRGDYQSILAKAAVKEGVQIRFGQRVMSVDVQTNQVILDGPKKERIGADLIIGADGLFSKAREAITVNEGIEPHAAQEYCFRYLVKREKMLQETLTAELIDGKYKKLSMLWSGPEMALLGYPISAGQLYNVVALVRRPGDAPLGRYNQPGDPNEMRSLFRDFDKTCQALLNHAGPDTEGCAKWTLSDLAELKSWRSDSGRVVLIGDAAHNMLPFAACGASSTIEDADVLASCLSKTLASVSRLSKLRCIAQATAIYQHIRRPRTTRLQEISRENAKTFMLPNGLLQEARDAKLKELMHEQEKRLKEGRDIIERNLTKPDMNAKYPSPEARMWVYGYDSNKTFEQEVEKIKTWALNESIDLSLAME